MTKDYAYSKTKSKSISAKQNILSALDALIAGMLMVLFIGIALGVGYLIFGR